MRGAEANVALYPWYRAASSMQAWIPVFFLYFSRHVPVDEVILLSSIYYAAVVALELPSGYFSDRAGRRPTLIVSSIALALAYALFIAGGGFAVLATAQVLLAAGIAFRSGTDTAFHYDALSDTGREGEFAAREARAEKLSLAALAGSTLAGGLLGGIDLRLAYALSLGGALASLLLALRFDEPTRSADGAAGFGTTLGRCIGALRAPPLAWLFAFHLAIFAVAHLPFEFYQPYVAMLVGNDAGALAGAPVLSGLVIAVSMFGGSMGAAASMRWRQRLGLKWLLLAAMALQLVIVAGMAAALHAAVLGLVFARNFPMALVHAPLKAAVAPRLSRNLRATYLSLESLAARLAFAALLAGLAHLAPQSAPIHWEALSRILLAGLAAGLAGAAVLLVTASALASTGDSDRADPP